jgi:hypothetical protein
MNNQHAGLSQVLAERRMTPTAGPGRRCAAVTWRSPAASPPHQVGGPSLGQLARWPGIAIKQPARHPFRVS